MRLYFASSQIQQEVWYSGVTVKWTSKASNLWTVKLCYGGACKTSCILLLCTKTVERNPYRYLEIVKIITFKSSSKTFFLLIGSSCSLIFTWTTNVIIIIIGLITVSSSTYLYYYNIFKIISIGLYLLVSVFFYVQCFEIFRYERRFIK